MKAALLLLGLMNLYFYYINHSLMSLIAGLFIIGVAVLGD
jgi:hypothetical protein